MSHIFISYSRKDIDFAGKIVQALAEGNSENKLDTWIDWKSIPKGEDWEQEIYRGIEEADAFLFLISPDSIVSKMCNKEIAHAVKNGKRILPIVIRDAKAKDLLLEDAKDVISKRNWIFCRDKQDDFDKALNEIKDTIHTDYEWLKYHTQLQNKALEWERNQKNTSRLLRGEELREAEKKLAETSSQKDPQPTSLQRQYVLFSQKEEERQRQRELENAQQLANEQQKRAEVQTKAAKRLRIFLVSVLVLAIAAFFFAFRSQQQTKLAQAEKERAELQAKLALSRQLAAQSINQIPVNNEFALLLAIESGKQAETFEADSALREVLSVTGSTSRNTPTSKILDGHTDSVNHVAWDPDGNRVVTASSDGTAKIWDVASGEEVYTLSGHKGTIWFVAWDPLGERVVTTGDDGTVRIWNASNGAELALFSPQGLFLFGRPPVGYAAWDPDGRRIATASYDGISRVLDAKTGEELLTLYGHTAQVSQITWSPNGNYIATASEDNTARIWNSETGETIAILEGNQWGGRTWPVRNATWSPDGSKLLTYETDNSALIWDTTTWDPKVTLAGSNIFGQPHAVIRHVAWDNEGKKVVITNANSSPEVSAEIWDAETERPPLVTFTGHESWVEYASWNNDNTKILTASLDGTVRIWDAATGEPLMVLTGHTGGLSMAAWSPDNRYIVSASEDGTARVWDLDPPSDLPEISFDAMFRSIGEIAWNPNGTKIVVTTSLGTPAIWNALTGKKLAEISNEPFNRQVTLKHPEWSPDGSLILTVGDDGRAYIWNGDNGSEVASLTPFTDASPEPPTLFAEWSPDGEFIAAVDVNGHVNIWTKKDYQEVVEFTASDLSTIRILSWSPDNNFIAISDFEGGVSIWEAATGYMSVELVGHQHPYEITGISWSRDASQIATSSEDGTARVWDAKSGEQEFILSGHSGRVYSVDWSPDGTRLLTSSSDGTAAIWDSQTGDPFLSLVGHTESVRHASWSPDGMRVVTASSDNTARIWDGYNGSVLALLSGHGDGSHFSGVVQAAWSPDGRYIATVGHDGRVLLHYTTVSDLVELGCQHAVRNMSRIEWDQYIKDVPYQYTCPELSSGQKDSRTPPQQSITLILTLTPTVPSKPKETATSRPSGDVNQKPVVGSAEDAARALDSDAKKLESLAVESPALPQVNQPGDIYVYKIDIAKSEPLIWSYGWCSTSEDILNVNLKYIELEFRLDDLAIPPGQIAVMDSSILDSFFCRQYYAVVDQWIAGKYRLEVQVTFSSSINDGLNDFPSGTHTFRYDVSVSQ